VSRIRTCAVPSGTFSATISDATTGAPMPSLPSAGRPSPLAHSGRRDLVMHEWRLTTALRFQSAPRSTPRRRHERRARRSGLQKIKAISNSKFRKLRACRDQPRGHDRQESTPGRTVLPRGVLTALNALISVVVVLCFAGRLGPCWEAASRHSSDGGMKWVARDRMGWPAGAGASWVGHSAPAAGC
jgi:hypothetical protein